jgi:hypothetical protein
MVQGLSKATQSSFKMYLKYVESYIKTPWGISGAFIEHL